MIKIYYTLLLFVISTTSSFALNIEHLDVTYRPSIDLKPVSFKFESMVQQNILGSTCLTNKLGSVLSEARNVSFSSRYNVSDIKLKLDIYKNNSKINLKEKSKLSCDQYKVILSSSLSLLLNAGIKVSGDYSSYLQKDSVKNIFKMSLMEAVQIDKSIMDSGLNLELDQYRNKKWIIISTKKNGKQQLKLTKNKDSKYKIELINNVKNQKLSFEDSLNCKEDGQLVYCNSKEDKVAHPYEFKKTKDIIMTSAGIALLSLSYVIEKKSKGFTKMELDQLDRSSVNSFDRNFMKPYTESTAKSSDFLIGLSLLMPFSILLDKANHQDAAEYGVMYFETLLLTAGLTNLVKNLVKRPRPLTYDPSAPMHLRQDPDARKSFYSGHTTFSFAAAVFLSTTYNKINPDSKWKNYVTAGSLALATTVGALRVSSGKHFASDVITGAVIGSAIGYLIPYIHEKEDLSFNYYQEGDKNTFEIEYTF